MAELKQVYRCNICENVVEILHAGQGKLVCCGQPMDLQMEYVKDEGFEKHVPVLKQKKHNIVVVVGEQLHPMTEEHHIEWIEVVFKTGKSCKNFLQKNSSPETEFCSDDEIKQVRAFCNIHGLWVNNLV